MRPVAVVQHEPSVPPGVVAGVLREASVEHFVVEAWRDPVWPDARDLGALVVLGGTMNVDQLDDYPFLESSRDLMRGAIEGGTPVMGVCLGSQMMARVLGGDVYRAEPRNAFFSPVRVADDPVVRPFAGVDVLQFHEDTFSLPSGAVELARSERSGLLQAFRYGATAYAVQFHFEVDAPIVSGWCRNVGDRALREEWGTSEEDLLAQSARFLPSQQRAGAELFGRFLELARETAG
ncbi:MAG TPA: type 1 glutamine amidotransferase, partial [Actinomycetota bacterium]|nr:type 1 glutamine amidotransferase [Actinomycetota bacterium]